MMRVRLMVTRPEEDGERTAATLRARGHDVLLCPLLRIEPIPDAGPGGGPWAAVLLTSSNAVRALAGHPRREAILRHPAFAVGPRTAAVAHEAGFIDVEAAEGDVDALAALVIRRLRGSTLTLLHLAGADRAGDLPGALAAQGLRCETAVIYRARMARTLPQNAIAALTGRRIDGVLHFSRRTASAYLACADAAGLCAEALQPTHYCLSAQVAEPLAAAGASDIRIARRPDELSLLGLVAP